jgi:biotin operon repressor
MIYQQSQEIESRLARLLELIRNGEYSTPALASTLNVSTPTISRCIFAVRRRGYAITAVRTGARWCYKISPNNRESPTRSGRR